MTSPYISAVRTATVGGLVPASIAQYEVRGALGKGAYGTVYLGYHPEMGRLVAIKELLAVFASNPAMLAWFRGEAQVMAALDHPNCVKVFDFLEIDHRALLVSEYVDGATLRRVMQAAGQLAPEQALGVVKGALLGLGYAHSRGLSHRDVKPENILVDREGVSKLADFGQAAFGSRPGPGGSSGSPGYMSPEQVAGAATDHRADIYSMGVILFELLTARLPFTSDSPAAVMHMHATVDAPDPRRYNPNLHPGAAELLSRALAKDPGARFQDCGEFLASLEAAAVEGYGPDWERSASVATVVAAAATAATTSGSANVGDAAVTTKGGVKVLDRVRGLMGVVIGGALLAAGVALAPGAFTARGLTAGPRSVTVAVLVGFGLLFGFSGARRIRRPRVRVPKKTLGLGAKLGIVAASIVVGLGGGGVAIAAIHQQDVQRQQRLAEEMRQFDANLAKLSPNPAGGGVQCPPGYPNYSAADNKCHAPAAAVTHACPAGYPFYSPADAKCHQQDPTAARYTVSFCIQVSQGMEVPNLPAGRTLAWGNCHPDGPVTLSGLAALIQRDAPCGGTSGTVSCTVSGGKIGDPVPFYQLQTQTDHGTNGAPPAVGYLLVWVKPA